MHDIGKNIVAMLLEGAGFEVTDLGADVPKEKFLEFVKNEGANILGMSALLTTTMIYMKETIEALKKCGFKGKCKSNNRRRPCHGVLRRPNRCGWICSGCCLCSGSYKETPW